MLLQKWLDAIKLSVGKIICLAKHFWTHVHQPKVQIERGLRSE